MGDEELKEKLVDWSVNQGVLLEDLKKLYMMQGKMIADAIKESLTGSKYEEILSTKELRDFERTVKNIYEALCKLKDESLFSSYQWEYREPPGSLYDCLSNLRGWLPQFIKMYEDRLKKDI